jgi:hypothetical protein
MFTELYLKTTDPRLSFYQVFNGSILANMLISIVFHTVVYVSFANLLCFIFTGKILSSPIHTRLLLTITFIMIFGFFARFLHVKEIYNAYHHDLEKTRNHLDKLYITWVFIS